MILDLETDFITIWRDTSITTLGGLLPNLRCTFADHLQIIRTDYQPLPNAGQDQVYVEVSALNGGSLTLPERLFVTDADPVKRATVPSLCFLIQHCSSKDSRPTRIVFDLGVKRDPSQYASGLHQHISQRHPMNTLPDVKDSLLAGGLDPAKDIDTVIPSHTHWDHIGTPTDFCTSRFIVGSGTLNLFKHGALHYPANMFDEDLLPRDRTSELPPTSFLPSKIQAANNQTQHEWATLSCFPHAIDFFGDGSMYIIDSPGHLQGHVNLLCRVSAAKWIYLGGDCCHDPRIIRGEKEIAVYDDGHGGTRSVHMDLQAAKETLERIKEFLNIHGERVEWIVAHDGEWAQKNKDKFFPGKM